MKLSYYMKIPVYNCTINDNINDESGIYAISFVDQPANETNFIALNKQLKAEYLSIDKKKQILTGVVLRPEQLIYRNDERIGEYYIKFSSDEIEKISQKMMKTGLALYSTTHQHEKPLNGNFLIELWTVINPENDKSNALGFKNLPKGTLMCSYKIEDQSYWDSKVMTGDVKGFSLEGFFMQEIDMSKVQIKNNSSMKKKKFVFNKLQRGVLSSVLSKQMLSDIEAVESEDTTESGDPFVIFTLSDGTEVYVDADGFATINEEQAPAGEHKLADGNLLVIDEQGQFVETREASTAVTEPEQATAAQTLSKKRKANLTKEKEKQTKAKQKLEEQTVNSDDVQSLKDRIAELEALLADLQSVTEEAVTEVQELKKKTPSANPVVQKQEKVDLSSMTGSQRIAHVAMLQIRNKK